MGDGLWMPVEGRYGRTRNGLPVGPMRFNPADRDTPWSGELEGVIVDYHGDGRRWLPADDAPHDLVAEWREEVIAPSPDVPDPSPADDLSSGDPPRDGEAEDPSPGGGGPADAAITYSDEGFVARRPGGAVLEIDDRGDELQLEITRASRPAMLLTKADAARLALWLLSWADRDYLTAEMVTGYARARDPAGFADPLKPQAGMALRRHAARLAAREAIDAEVRRLSLEASEAPPREGE